MPTNPFHQKGYVRVGNEIFPPKKAKPLPSAIETVKVAGKTVCERKNDGLEPVIETKLYVNPSTDVQKLNKTEKEFWAYLQLLNYAWIGCQNITLKLAEDTRYTCDFFAIGFDGELIGFETKGFMRPQARVKLYVAARQFLWIRFKLVKKIKNGWDISDIKP